MRQISAIAMLAAIAGSISIMFVQARWVTTVPEVAAFLIGAAWLVALAVGAFRPRFSWLFIPLAGTVVWGVYQVQAGVTVYPWRTWAMVLYWSANLSFFFAAVQTFSDSAVRKWFLRATLWFGFVTCIVSTLQALTVNEKVYWLFETDFARWNVFGPFVYHNQYAAFIELILPIALYFAFTDRRRRWLFLGMAAAMYASVIACGSRAGFVLCTGELLWTPFVATRGRRRTRGQPILRAAAVLAGMIVMLAAAAGPDILIEKFGQKDPFTLRREYNISSLAMIKARPAAGFGLGTWPTAYPGYAIIDNDLFANQAHDDWAQWAVEGGLPFAALILLIALITVPRGLNTGWGAGIAAVFLHSFVDYPLQKHAIALLLFALIAAVEFSSEGRQRSKDVEV